MFSVLPPIAPLDAPPPPGLWPLPPGWWLVILAVFLISMWGGSTWIHRGMVGWRRKRPAVSVKVMALAALNELEGRGQMRDRDVAYRLNEILRAALLDADRHQEGEGQWQPFSPQPEVVDDRAQWEAFWMSLEMRYRRPDEDEDDVIRQREWLATARRWLERLPDDDGLPERP
ncbi:MAG TPA: DUF4381 family protein [Mariprofundaceae bacterium]|nr:DUF4381 family protein [Mariprofundaceae bacterium]